MDFKLSPKIDTLHSIKAIFNWLVPKHCIQCSRVLLADSCCCEDCYPDLPFQSHVCCRCGQALNAQLDYCGRCLTKPPAFDVCFCPFQYKPPISDQIQRFKYSQRPEMAYNLAKLLAKEIFSNRLAMPELLIPVPVHISRLRQRGYNQSLLLTRHLSKLLQIPYSNSHIEKHHRTPAQVSQPLKQRKTNVRGCFLLKQPFTAQHVAIIDDVFTTGSTTEEMTKILKKNGVNYVQIWAIAHTI